MTALKTTVLTRDLPMPANPHVCSDLDCDLSPVPAAVLPEANFACEIAGESHSLTADSYEEFGIPGRVVRPEPSVCSALSGDLATDCWTWAARLGVQLEKVVVETQVDARDMDSLGQRVSAGGQRLSCSIQVASLASEDAIIHVVELAKTYNAGLSDLANSMSVECDLTILRANGKARP